MKIARMLVLAAACWSANAMAAAPTDESILELLRLTRAESMMDSVNASMEQMMRSAMGNAVKGEKLSPSQQKVLDQLPARFAALLREESNWATMQPDMVAIYRDSFSQDEIDAQVAFYRSPGGQAVIAKMPVVMQKSMEMSERQMQRLMPKMQTLIKELTAEAKATK